MDSEISQLQDQLTKDQEQLKTLENRESRVTFLQLSFI